MGQANAALTGERTEEKREMLTQERDQEIWADRGWECGNCGTWRRLSENGTLEDCPYCGDEEIEISALEEGRKRAAGMVGTF